jgi:putative tricarboxylic transport membrane protein
MRHAGFFVMTLLFLLLVLKYIEGQSWKSTFMVGIATTAASYLLFEVWLGVPLPIGFMKDWLP